MQQRKKGERSPEEPQRGRVSNRLLISEEKVSRCQGPCCRATEDAMLGKLEGERGERMAPRRETEAEGGEQLQPLGMERRREVSMNGGLEWGGERSALCPPQPAGLGGGVNPQGWRGRVETYFRAGVSGGGESRARRLRRAEGVARGAGGRDPAGPSHFLLGFLAWVGAGWLRGVGGVEGGPGGLRAR